MDPIQSRVTAVNSSHDLCVFIGRFQPFHVGHLQVVREGLRSAKKLCVLIGSARQARNTRNPWTFEERRRMIEDSLTPDELANVVIRPLQDSAYNDTQWIEAVQSTVASVLAETEFDVPLNDPPSIALIGHKKDNTSYYLDLFPRWASVDVVNHLGLNSTQMRGNYFSDMVEMWLADADGHKVGDNVRQKVIPSGVRDFLIEFSKTEAFKQVRREFIYIDRYKRDFDYVRNHFPENRGREIAPIFVTVDACVVQSGNILLVRRRDEPGKGLWALPGGFLNPDETVLDGMLRELREETRIKVPMPALRGNIVAQQVFDDPYRSARGRTITHGFLIKLPPGELPRVKAADDAERAQWWPLSEVVPEMMFEDHYAIIFNLVGRI